MRLASDGVTLLTGGARSGKSAAAVRLGRAWQGAVSMVVTAEALDEEMAHRIARHRQDRPEGWNEIEEPLVVGAALATVDQHDLFILDCVTMWVSNLMLSGLGDDEILECAERLGAQLAGRQGPSIVVTNEVGAGVHPPTADGMRYRDLLGGANQRLAIVASDVVLMVAGRALVSSEEPLAW